MKYRTCCGYGIKSDLMESAIWVCLLFCCRLSEVLTMLCKVLSVVGSALCIALVGSIASLVKTDDIMQAGLVSTCRYCGCDPCLRDMLDNWAEQCIRLWDGFVPSNRELRYNLRRQTLLYLHASKVFRDDLEEVKVGFASLKEKGAIPLCVEEAMNGKFPLVEGEADIPCGE